MSETILTKIVNWFTGAVIFKAQISAELSAELRMGEAVKLAVAAKVDLYRASLVGARLDGARLVGARLVGARLDGASLVGASLDGASLGDGIQIGGGRVATIAPISLLGLRWPVMISDEHMQIGCQVHLISAWADFDDRQIIKMDRSDALRFWRRCKAPLLAMCEQHRAAVARAAEAKKAAA